MYRFLDFCVAAIWNSEYAQHQTKRPSMECEEPTAY